MKAVLIRGNTHYWSRREVGARTHDDAVVSQTQPACCGLSFQYNKFKCRILKEKVTTPTTSIYR